MSELRDKFACPECGGTGIDYCDSCFEEGLDGVGHGDCPSCHGSGLVGLEAECEGGEE